MHIGCSSREWGTKARRSVWWLSPKFPYYVVQASWDGEARKGRELIVPFSATHTETKRREAHFRQSSNLAAESPYYSRKNTFFLPSCNLFWDRAFLQLYYCLIRALITGQICVIYVTYVWSSLIYCYISTLPAAPGLYRTLLKVCWCACVTSACIANMRQTFWYGYYGDANGFSLEWLRFLLELGIHR